MVAIYKECLVPLFEYIQYLVAEIIVLIGMEGYLYLDTP